MSVVYRHFETSARQAMDSEEWDTSLLTVTQLVRVVKKAKRGHTITAVGPTRNVPSSGSSCILLAHFLLKMSEKGVQRFQQGLYFLFLVDQREYRFVFPYSDHNIFHCFI